ncbi:fibronectin type III domain-containing protein [Nocardioides sp. OK12]|uniref:fibronectin type III domain-containing protein n=1 Tax=Nocardioides sp. OK12 TaxID=2758661 RepID=UPI0021C47681|nr:fibronectin type III domain-containing protein [Nocardioides sp. OK12]
MSVYFTHRGFDSPVSRTDDQGQFTLPLEPHEQYALTFGQPLNNAENGSYLFLNASPQPGVKDGHTDLGVLTLPPLKTHRIMIVDADGAPVHSGYVGDGSSSVNEGLRNPNYEWEDVDASLTPDGSMYLYSGGYHPRDERSGTDGTVTFLGPRIPTRMIYAEAFHYDQSVSTTAHARTRDGYDADGLWTVRLLSFRVGPPLQPAQPNLTPLDHTSLRVDLATQRYDGGRPITEHIVTLEPGGQSITIPAHQQSVTFTGLDADTDHTVQVLATNDVGNSPKSTPRTVTTSPAPPPGPDPGAGPGPGVEPGASLPPRPARPRASVVRSTGAKVAVAVRWSSGYGTTSVDSYTVTANGKAKTTTTSQKAKIRLRPGVWKIRIVAENEAGSSDPSSAKKVRVYRP